MSTDTTQPSRDRSTAPPTIHRGASETRLDALLACTCAPDAPSCTCARSRAIRHRAG